MPKRIPSNLIVYWSNKKELPAVYQNVMKNNELFTKDLNKIYIDDKTVLDMLVNDKFLYDLFGKIQAPSVKSEMAKLLFIYKYGGIYINMSFMLKKPLYLILDNDTDVALLQRDDQPRYSQHPDRAHIATMMIASTPKSPFIESCLIRLINILIKGHFNHYIEFAATKYIDESYNEYLDSGKIKDLAFQMLSFKDLKDGYLHHMKIAGVSDQWKAYEKKGIFRHNDLKKLQNEYIKREHILFMNEE